MGVGDGRVSVDQIDIGRGGCAVWRTPTAVLYSTTDDGVRWYLAVYDTVTRTSIPLPETSGANEIAAGGGRWLAWTAERGVYGSITDPRAGLSLTDGDGRGGAGEDGTLALIADRQAGVGLQLHAPSGLVAFASPGAAARQVHVLGPARALWRTEAGALQQIDLVTPVQVGPAYGPRWVDVPGETPWVCYWTPAPDARTPARLVAHPIDATIGVVLAIGDAAFYHDARVVGGRLVVAYATGPGELPHELVVVPDGFALPRVDLRPGTVPPERPRCRIVSYPARVTAGDPAVCQADYSGGPATSASWLFRSLGEVVWVTDAVQAPPRATHAYAFTDPGIVDISLRVDGPGGSDETASLRRITIDAPSPQPDPGTRGQICFGPNLGTSDFAQLFTESNLWQWGFDRIGAFQFYQGHFSLYGRDYGNRFCGVNTFEWLNGANAFTKLQAAGILIEVQVAGKSLDTLEKIVAKFAALDPPVTLGGVCYDHAFMELSGQEFATEVRTIRERWPHMVIGAYCAYPMASVNHIFERLEVWDAYGGRPDFLRMDVDYNQRSVYTADVHRQIRELVADRSDPPMTLQVTINAKEHISDAEWVRQGAAWFDYCQALGFDGYAVQSWASTPSEEDRQLPHNLPESDPTSHTALLRGCLEALR